MISELFVHLYPPGETESRVVGKLVRKDGFYHFVYGRRYLASSSAFPLDPLHLPLGERIYSERGLYYSLGVFRDASPDLWGRRVIAAMLGKERLSELDYLLHSSGRHRVGALEFSETLEPVRKQAVRADLPELLDATRKLETGQSLPDELLLALQGGSSMGGARPKAVVHHEGELWLAKFPSKADRSDIPTLEHKTLALARQCGIDVAESKLVEVASVSVLLVKRFDRLPQVKGWTRKHYLSGLTLMGCADRESWRHSYLLLADQLRRMSLQREELFRRMSFNVLIKNQDDHARNHGFFYDGQALSYTPAFDLVPGFGANGALDEQAMVIGQFGRQSSTDNALSNAERFGLEKEKANAIIEQMEAVIRSGC